MGIGMNVLDIYNFVATVMGGALVAKIGWGLLVCFFNYSTTK